MRICGMENESIHERPIRGRSELAGWREDAGLLEGGGQTRPAVLWARRDSRR